MPVKGDLVSGGCATLREHDGRRMGRCGVQKVASGELEAHSDSTVKMLRRPRKLGPRPLSSKLSLDAHMSTCVEHNDKKTSVDELQY